MKVACKKERASKNIGEIGSGKFCKEGWLAGLVGLVALMREQWDEMCNLLNDNALAYGVGFVRGFGVESGGRVDLSEERAGGGSWARGGVEYPMGVGGCGFEAKGLT